MRRKEERGKRKEKENEKEKSEMACLGLNGFVAVVVKREGGRRRDGAGPDNTVSNNLVVHECVQVQQVSRLFAISAT